MSTIEILDYTKILKKKTVLNGITYTFREGTIYGLYGRNGSGKTMLLRAIAGLIFPTEGEIHIDGRILHKDMDFPANMGLIIEKTDLLPQYSSFENLKLLASIKKTASEEDIYDALRKVGLNPEDKKPVRTYSLGMKQRLAIAQAIFEKPEILLLDEPTNALDEKCMADIRSLLLEYKEKGCLIIIASHNKEDIELLCDEVLIVEDGQIQGNG